MKKVQKRIIAIIIASALVITGIGAMVSVVLADENKDRVDIIFTSDMHSNLNSFVTPYRGEEGVNIGGFARVATIAGQIRENNPDALWVDGGDFSMGTLFHTLFESQAVELRVMGAMGVDVTTWGNHEFNFGSEGVINMLQAAMDSGDKLPKMVECNIDWSNPGDEQATKDAFDKFGIKPYTMIKKGKYNIAVIGVFGDNALKCEPTCTVPFRTSEEERIEYVQKAVDDIKAKEDADMIVCVSHSGLSGDVGSGTTEDEVLAQNVPDLDLILAGHSHTELEEPLVYGNTYVVACGEYTEAVGTCSLSKSSNGRWHMDSYELVNTYDTVAADPEIQERIDSFVPLIDEEYLSQFGLSKTQVLAQTDFDFTSMADIEEDHRGQNLGDFMSDAFLYGARQAEPDTHFDMGVVPSGTIRGTYNRGDITVDDVFNSYSLGIGPDKVPGYPLIKIYLTGEEMKTIAEIDASVSDLFGGIRLYMSGEEFTYNPNRMLLNKVTEVYLVDENGNKSEFEDDKLYCVVADLYEGQMLGSVVDASYGLLEIIPKDENGEPITDYNEAIIHDANGREVKAWDSMAALMQSFDKNEEGISQVPDKYRDSHDRKIRDDNNSLGAKLSSPNKFTAMVVCAILVVVIIVVLIVMLIVYIVRRIRFGKNYKRIKQQKRDQKRERKMTKRMAKKG